MEATLHKQGAELADGRYVLERRLGTGGMATVWLARDTRLARPVAVKLPSRELSADDTFAQRFEHEARTAAALSHPNLVPVFDYGSECGRPYLVSEFINGSNLARVRADGDAPPTEDVARALLDALSHIHESGIVHRDIKPGNVLVDRGGRILLTDFGIAQSGTSTQLTSPGMVVGTITYLAPEVRKGGRATPSSDLYACGTVLKQQLSLDDPENLAWLATELTRADPADRPETAEDALDLLERGPGEGESRSGTAVMPAFEPDMSERPDPVRIHGAPPPLPPLDRSRFNDDDDLDLDDDPEPSGDSPPSREFPLPPGAGEPKPDRNRAFPLGILAGLILVVGIVGFALASGGDDDTSGDGSRVQLGVGMKNTPPTNEVTTTETTPAPAAPAPDPAPADTGAATDQTGGTGGQPVSTGNGDDPAAGDRLNQKGYGLLQAGDPASALPILQRAVSEFPDDSTDDNYAFALFNYAQALRLTGDPADAIPLLQKRLSISDFRVEDVQAELAAAQAAAGGGPTPKAPKAPKAPAPSGPYGGPPGPDGYGPPPGHYGDDESGYGPGPG